LKKLNGTTAVKIADSGSIQCYENASFDKNLTVTGTSSLGTVESILFNQNASPPTLLTRSIGTKLILYPSIGQFTLDYSIGIESGNMFFTTISSSSGYKFYAGAGESNVVCNINGSGDLTTKAGVNCKSLTVSSNSNSTIAGNLTVDGSLSSAKGPWFCAGRINTGTGGIFADYGRVSYTVRRDSQASVTITMASPHPQNGNYVCMASSSKAFTTIENNISGLGMRTSTTFQIVLRNADFTTIAGDTNSLTFMVV
jgi:hypothetical protein